MKIKDYLEVKFFNGKKVNQYIYCKKNNLCAIIIFY